MLEAHSSIPPLHLDTTDLLPRKWGRGLTLNTRRAAAHKASSLAKAEGTRESGLDAPVEGRVRALQALAPVLAGAHRTLVLIHLAPLATVA